MLEIVLILWQEYDLFLFRESKNKMDFAPMEGTSIILKGRQKNHFLTLQACKSKIKSKNLNCVSSCSYFLTFLNKLMNLFLF